MEGLGFFFFAFWGGCFGCFPYSKGLCRVFVKAAGKCKVWLFAFRDLSGVRPSDDLEFL